MPQLPDQLVPVDLAVIATGRSHKTIRTWVRRLEVRAACDVRTRQLRVSIADTLRHDRAKPRAA